MGHPLVSVILSTYNREEYLPRAIDSVLSQDYRELELIVVDDGSTDHTRQVVESYKDSRIRYMRTPVNKGVAAARNAGIRRAKGELIAFQDSDDVWRQGKLTKQVETLEKASENVAMVYCIMTRINKDETYRLLPDENILKQERQGNLFERLLRGNFIGAPTICVRRAVLTGSDGVGVFDTMMPNLEDYELLLRIAKKYQVAYIDEVLIDTYLLGDSTNSNLLNGVISNCMILEKYKDDMMRLGLYQKKLGYLRDFGKLVHREEAVDEIIRRYCEKD